MKSVVHTLNLISCYLFLPAMAVLISAQVIARHFFSSPLQWAFEANGLLLLITVFGCLPSALENNHHIRADVFLSMFGSRMRKMAELAAAAAGLIFVSFLGYESILHVPEMLRFNESGEFLAIPHWPFSAFIGVSAVTMMIQLAIHIWHILSGRSHREY